MYSARLSSALLNFLLDSPIFAVMAVTSSSLPDRIGRNILLTEGVVHSAWVQYSEPDVGDEEAFTCVHQWLGWYSAHWYIENIDLRAISTWINILGAVCSETLFTETHVMYSCIASCYWSLLSYCEHISGSGLTATYTLVDCISVTRNRRTGLLGGGVAGEVDGVFGSHCLFVWVTPVIVGHHAPASCPCCVLYARIPSRKCSQCVDLLKDRKITYICYVLLN